MKFRNKLFILMAVLSLILSACGGASNDAMEKPEDMGPADTMMEQPSEQAMEPHDNTMMDTTTSETAMDDSMSDTMMESPAWFSATLTDVNTGDAFTINDLKGKVVLVETMAVWCTNCFRQQSQVKGLHAMLGERDDFVSLGIDIDLNEDATKLKGFIEAKGFDWMYAVASADVARDLSAQYGAQFLNPPSTPMLIIDRKGVAHTLPFGIKSADDLLKALQPYLDEAM